jgi:hypothetical protein
MRGKHKNAAAHRRDRDELVREAEDGQCRSAKAEKELAELKEKSERQIEGLRAGLANAVKDRDAAASPQLEAAYAHIRELNQVAIGLQKELTQLVSSRGAYQRTTVAFLVEALLAAGVDRALVPAIRLEFRRKIRDAAAREKQIRVAGRRSELALLGPIFGGEEYEPEAAQ